MPDYQANCADVRVAGVEAGPTANDAIVDLILPGLPNRKYLVPVAAEYLQSVLLVGVPVGKDMERPLLPLSP